MTSIGFFAHHQKNRAVALHMESHESLLRFDSGRGVTFCDACHHLLTLGTTGSGKTASVILPALQSLIRQGRCGLIIDIKGNMTQQTHAIAQAYGREVDIIELGSSSDALRINLLAGMGRQAIYELFETMTLSSFSGMSHNLDFHIKGVAMAADCAALLNYLHVVDTDFEANLKTIAEMVNNYTYTNSLYNYFKASVYNRSDIEQSQFVHGIEANAFHIFVADRKKGSSRSTKEEQLTYATQAIRIALNNFMDVDGLGDNFANASASGLDMAKALAENKIILLRFSADVGPIGEMLARVIVQEYYKAIYAVGLTMPTGKQSFICMDEFQNIADLSSGRFSDVNFIAQAREFNAIFIAATQSVSSMMSRGASHSAVEAFMSNCNNKVLFYSDDPLTQNMVDRYDSSLKLTSLAPSHAFVTQFCKAKRQHFFGEESFQDAFSSANIAIQHNAYAPKEIREDKPNCIRPSLHELATRLLPPKKTEERDAMSWVERSFVADVFKDTPQEEPLHLIDEAELYKKHAQFFIQHDPPFGSVPKGWLSSLDQALTAFLQSGLMVRIKEIYVEEGSLQVSESSYVRDGVRPSTAVTILNGLLSGTKKLCPLCGSKINLKSQIMNSKGYWVNEASPACQTCLCKYRLGSSPKMQKEGEDHE